MKQDTQKSAKIKGAKIMGDFKSRTHVYPIVLVPDYFWFILNRFAIDKITQWINKQQNRLTYTHGNNKKDNYNLCRVW